MTIFEDTYFNYWNNERKESQSILDDIKDTMLVFHPHDIEKNAKKIKQHCPNFYGEIEEGKQFIMEKKNGLCYLNHDFELIKPDTRIITHFNGNMFLEEYCSDSYTLKNNQNQVLFKDINFIKEINTSYFKLYRKYTDSKNSLYIVISKTGRIHITHNNEIVFVNQYFYEQWDATGLYILYDSNCQPVATAINKDEVKTIVKQLQTKKNHFCNPLEKRRQELYQKFLYLQWYKKFGIKEKVYENYIQTITKELMKQRKAYAYDLETDCFIEGTFKNYLKLEEKHSTLLIEDLQDLENALEEYKREKALLPQNNKQKKN